MRWVTKTLYSLSSAPAPLLHPKIHSENVYQTLNVWRPVDIQSVHLYLVKAVFPLYRPGAVQSNVDLHSLGLDEV